MGGSVRYVSVFSGIEAASVAWEPLGWEPAAFCEIDAFPSAVLAERYPDVPNLGDITKVDWGEFINEHGRPDVLVGGSPCQSFSIAGGRESLGGESRLMFEYIRAVQDLRPRWLLWENVPGVLNTRDNAFVQLLDSLQELGYSLAWRVLDAQFFGVAQRRRRVFLVGHLGDGGACAAVLFESESVRGNTAPSREKRQKLATCAKIRSGSPSFEVMSFKWWQGAAARSVAPYSDGTTSTLTNSDSHVPAIVSATEVNGCLTPWDVQSKRVFSDNSASPSLQSGTTEGANIQPCVLAFAQNTRDEVRVQGDGTISGALSAQPGMKQTTYVISTANTNANGSNVSQDDVSYTLDGTNCNAVCMASGQANAEINQDGISPTLTLLHEAPIVIDRAAYNQGENAQYPPHIEQTELMDSLVARGPHAVSYRAGTM